MTGVVYSVSAWLTINPPTMVIPRGWRNSEPVPVPKASGTAPKSAASVVIMIGTEAQHASLEDRVLGAFAMLPLGDQGKVNHHDGVLLHQANEQYDADN